MFMKDLQVALLSSAVSAAELPGARLVCVGVAIAAGPVVVAGAAAAVVADCEVVTATVQYSKLCTHPEPKSRKRPPRSLPLSVIEQST